ncbi:MAG: DnaD domain protein [Clostridia bacterium]|nr:DnaD domain protein [Clostridia bacterium]
MDYFVNPSCFSSAFAVPVDLCDKYLKLAKGEHIKVLLYMLRNNTLSLSEDVIAEALALSVYDVKEALLFWADAGILMSKEVPKVVKESKKAYQKIIKPSLEDINLRSQSDPKIKWLMDQSQMVFGRNLKGNERQTLVWLYDDLGLDIDVLFIILNYAKSAERLNITFIQSIAVEWLNKGIDTVAAADEELRTMATKDLAWSMVRSAFGLGPRKPGSQEKKFAETWVNEWQMSKEMLEAAYDVCVDATSGVSFSYINKVLENWYKSGFKTVSDIKKEEKPDKKHGGAYDLDLFEKMLNSKE